MTTTKVFFVDTDDFRIKEASGESEKLVIAGYANTVDEDRGGDVVLAEAWTSGIDNFRKNPILLFQHNHSQPVGKVSSVTVDNKGLYVEAEISEAAEKQHGLKTLIKDGVLKSFSVGFRIKDAIYDRVTDLFTIKELELLEISVVSVPMNQNSLFHIKKSFEDTEELEQFKQKFTVEEEKATNDIEQIPVTVELEEVVDRNPPEQIPFINLLGMDTRGLTVGTAIKMNGSRYVVSEAATTDSPYFVFQKCNTAGEQEDEYTKMHAEDVLIINPWDLGTKYDINVVKNSIVGIDEIEKTLTTYKENTKMTEPELWALKSNPAVDENEELQKVLNKTINLSSISTDDWDNSHLNMAKTVNMIVESLKSLPEGGVRDLYLNVYGYKTDQTHEEKNNMATENVGDIEVIQTNKTDTETKAVASVSEPEVTKLVQKTGEKLLEADVERDKAIEQGREPDRALMEELAELRGQMKAMRDQINATQNSKMVYNEQSRGTQFSDVEMTNAVLLAKALRTGNFDTDYGSRMKAVITNSKLTETFSTNVYNELRMKLEVTPMFRSINVPTKSFTVPVADEDADDFVAQFKSGTFAGGVTDNTTVPTSRQAQIAGVDLTPHKFMTSTHIAKDEDEDTLIPLLEFLRESSVRRLARGIEKALLRGTGAAGVFTTDNTLAVATGYPSVIKGIVNHAAGIGGLVTKTASTTATASPADIATARAKLGRYGLSLGANLAYITSVEGYNALVADKDFLTVDKLGPQATYLTGSVGAVFGIPVYVSEFMDATGGADRALGVLVYKPGFLIGERRAMEIESEYLPRQQVTGMYMSTRIDFKALTTETNAALSTRYSFASVITSAS